MKYINLFVLLLISPILGNSQYIYQDSTLNQQEHNSDVKNHTLRKRNNLVNHNRARVFELLRGTTSGIDITSSSGAPGASISAVIRGYNSIINTNTPLIVLDGMVINNDEFNASNAGVDQTNRLLDINMNDIESVKVIKGVIGSAKYGIRGSNGVLELTSKKGKTRAFTVNFSSAISLSNSNKLVPLQNTYAQGRGEYFGPELRQRYSWGPRISDLEYDGNSNYPFDSRGRLVPAGTGNGEPAVAYDPYSFFTSALSTDYNLSFGQRTDKFDYRVSGGVNNAEGVIPTTSYNRSSISANMTIRPTSKIKINTGVRYVSSNANKNIKGASTSGIMLGMTRTAPSFDNANGLSPEEALNTESAYTLSDGSIRSYANGIYDNPYWSINNNPNTNTTNRFIGNVYISYALTETSKISLLTGIDQYTELQVGGVSINQLSNPGSAYENKREFVSQYHKASYSIDLNPNSKLSLTNEIGIDFFTSDSQDENLTGFQLQAGQPIDIVNALSLGREEFQSTKATSGVYLNSSMSWSEMINLQLVGRYDKSSALGTDNNGLFSFAVNTDIDLLRLGADGEQSDSNNHLYLSVGVGRTGNDLQGSANRRTVSPLSIAGDGFIQPDFIPSLNEVSTIAQNGTLGAEKTDGLELGIKTVNFDNRFSLAANFYYEKTTDIIRSISVDNSSGYSLLLANDFTIVNKGLEIDLMAEVIQNKYVGWTLRTNITKNINTAIASKSNQTEVVLGGFNSASVGVVIDQPYGAIIGTAFERNAEDQIVIGSDGFPLVAAGRRVIGETSPDFLVNIANDIRIGKHISLSGLLEIRSGGDLWCGTCGVLDYFGTSQLSADERDRTTVIEGVTESGNPNTTAVNLANTEASAISDFYRVRFGFGGLGEMNVFDASWIRLRQVSLNYTIEPKGITFISNVQVGLYAHNLLLITDYPGIDPETSLTGAGNARGLDYFNNPNTKSFGFSINATF